MELAIKILNIFEEIETSASSFEEICELLCSIKNECTDYIDNYIGGMYEEYNGGQS